MKRSKPMHFVDVARRARALSKRNKRGETTLHCAATRGVRAGLDPRTSPLARTLQVTNFCRLAGSSHGSSGLMNGLMD